MRRHPRPHLGHPGLGPMGPPPMRPRGPPPLRPRGPPGHMGPPRGPRPSLGIPPMPGRAPPHMAHAVSSCTNSSDPASMDSRLFVGNLNTLALSKEAIERIFSHYGLVIGISMHKGYAFIQFSNSNEARRAGASEDGKVYAGQNIDINIVSQPKSRNAQKRPTSAGRPVNDAPVKKPRSVNDTPATNQSLQRTLVTLSGNTEATKRLAANNAVKRAIATATRKTAPRSGAVKSASEKARPLSSTDIKAASWPDVLICGVCKLQFSSLHSLAQHKKVPCGLRVSTQAKDESGEPAPDGEPALLVCASCEAEFSSAWSLCLHCTEEHQMNIYKATGSETKKTDGGDAKKESAK